MGKIFMLLILGLGVALAVPKSRAAIVPPAMNRIYAQIVPRRLQAIASQLENRVRRGEGLPNNNGWESWLDSNSSSSPEDPWDNVYYLDRRRDGFTVGSMGPDGVKGTPDDYTDARQYGGR